MIQDIYPHRLRNEFIPDRPLDGAGLAFLFRGPDVLCRVQDNEIALPQVRDFPEAGEYRFLFSLDSVPCYLAAKGPAEAPVGWEYTMR